jgi:hypothetical protein
MQKLKEVTATNFAELNGSYEVIGVTIIVDNTNPVRNIHFVLLAL